MRKVFEIFKWVVVLGISFLSNQSYSQNWSADGICDFTSGQQWNSSPSIPCACTWLSLNATNDTVINCAFGDCGQSDFLECLYDCNGHLGNPTDQIQRNCSTADPLCWYQATGPGPDGSEFCIGVTLPVEFIGISGFTNGRTNVIEWSTATEYNSSHFILERSQDGKNYSYVATIPSVGNATYKSNYRALDMSPLLGVTYYKLTQYDFDGAWEELGDIAIDNRPKEISQILDLTGRKTTLNTPGFKILIFTDGTQEKIIR